MHEWTRWWPLLLVSACVARDGASIKDLRNTAVRRFEGVTKPNYHLVESEEEEFEDDDSSIAVVDMGLLLSGEAGARREFVAALGDSLRNVGFAVLVGHGVDEAITSRAPAEIEHFFRRHTLQTKQRFKAQRKGSVNQGYLAWRRRPTCSPTWSKGGSSAGAFLSSRTMPSTSRSCGSLPSRPPTNPFSESSWARTCRS